MFARLAVALAVTSPVVAQTELEVVELVDGLDNPLFAQSPPGDARIFIIEQFLGTVRILMPDGELLATPFLDIGGTIATANAQGLLGLAFHPQFAQNGRLFTVHSALDGRTVLSEYHVSAGDPNLVDPSFEETLLSLAQPNDVHNGGALAFGPLDGMLYIAFGDGGLQPDPTCNAQRPDTWLGKVLRLDVDAGTPYSIPLDNPYVGSPQVLPEIWAAGLRQPWRMSFDPVTGELWIADVGMIEREEISVDPPLVGGLNYGWKLHEGEMCGPDGSTGCSPLVNPCGDALYVDPVYEYDHLFGCAIIGGVVYRGTRLAGYEGHYFFGDHCGGRIWSGSWDGEQLGPVVDHLPEFGWIAGQTHIGTDHNGEILIVQRTGSVARIVPGDILSADIASVSVGAGGTQNMVIAGDPLQAGYTYLVLGSFSGTAPGVAVGGELLPLNLDFYLTLTATAPNLPPLVDTLGVLDGNGVGNAAFTTGAGQLPAIAVGMTAHHAAALLSPTLEIESITNAVPLTFLD